jgi:hypothetical protein
VPWRSKHPLSIDHTCREPFFQIRLMVWTVVKISVKNGLTIVMKEKAACKRDIWNPCDINLTSIDCHEVKTHRMPSKLLHNEKAAIYTHHTQVRLEYYYRPQFVLLHQLHTSYTLRFLQATLRFLHAMLRFLHATLRFLHAMLRFLHATLRFLHATLRFSPVTIRFSPITIRFLHATIRFLHATLRFVHAYTLLN